jgi:hypothetical protein
VTEGWRMSVKADASSTRCCASPTNEAVLFCTALTKHYGFQEQRESKLDPITDIFRTMHVTAFGLHRLEATAPWGVRQEKQTEEKVTHAGIDQAHSDVLEEFLE